MSHTGRATVTRRATFAAAHRLFRPEWDDARNLAVFGHCAHPGGHGHNYVLEVTVAGEIDAETGMVADLGWLKSTMERHVVSVLDHRNLNRDVPFLAGVVPTAENIARAIFEQLETPVSARAILTRVRVVESENNSATYERPT